MNFFEKFGLGIAKKCKFLPQKTYAHIFYKYYYKKKLNLDNPVEFNEKIQWLKVYYHPHILTKLVDKYEVRKYVKGKVGAEYLNDLFALYNKVSEVNFKELPSQFVLKTTHGYNNNIIVRDKASLNKIKSRFLLSKWMLRNQYYQGGQEWAYKNAPHRIIAEKYLREIDKGISDFKFYCFNGNPKFIEISSKVNSKIFRSYFDVDWNSLEFGRIGLPLYDKKLKRPANLEEMVDVATELANGFPFIRVDLYDIKGSILFGELTFYPADARNPFHPEKYNKIIGDMMELPEVPKGQKEIKKI